jgi:hypothetical protein
MSSERGDPTQDGDPDYPVGTPWIDWDKVWWILRGLMH